MINDQLRAEVLFTPIVNSGCSDVLRHTVITAEHPWSRANVIDGPQGPKAHANNA